MSNISQFAISVLQNITEEKRTTHLRRWNKVKQQQIFRLGYVIKSHIQVQSRSETGEVKKLSYQEGGLSQAKTVLGNDLYEVQHFNSS